MRIVIDLQAAQTGSRYRGIGHYSKEFIKALVRNRPNDEIFLALNGLFPDSIESIRAEFDDILPQERIRVWYTPGPIEHFGDGLANLREIAEATREFFLRSLEPDLILISSIFEGLGDGAVITVKKFVTDVPVAAISYDLTPLHMPDEHFQTNPVYRRWYRNRIENLRRCDLLLAISESSRQEVIDQVGVAQERVINILGGRNEEFTRRTYHQDDRNRILESFGINKPFILYVGGLEPSKNLKMLVHALSHLPPKLSQNYEFVCVGKRNPGEIELIQGLAQSELSRKMIRTVGFVSQSELIDLYNLCDLFVFPSLREGLGLPPLEAMACGAPTIVSDRTSLPEVVGNSNALFDPISSKSIAAKIDKVLSDRAFRDSLVDSGLQRAGELTWDASASKAAREFSDRFATHHSLDDSRRTVLSHTSLFKPNQKRIIVQKLDHHGDFLLGLPAMAKIRARYRDARIDVLVGSWNRAAAQASGLFDEIHVLDFFKAKSSVPAGLNKDEFDALLARLAYYDYAVDLRRQSDTRFILTKLKANQYFGYQTGNERIDRLLTEPLNIHPDAAGIRGYFDETHTCVQMLKIVDALPFDPNDYVRLPDLGDRMPMRPGTIAIFPRVGNDARQWDTQYFEQLINDLAADPVVTEINLFCGRASELDDIRVLPNPKIQIHAGLAFADLFSALSGNQVCVGNNSLGVHLAGYAGCRTIGIYSGHELPQQWGPPFGDSLAITVDAACAPCHLPSRESCPFDTFCLNDISVGTVKSAVLDAIAGRPISENYSRISRINPATAVKPLMDALNKSKSVGNIDELTPENRIALAASVSINFPERTSARRCIYLDVSGSLEPDVQSRSNRQYRHLRDTISLLTKNAGAMVIPIASGQHDHEFYSVDLTNLESSLFGAGRSERVVTPLAGDCYVGLHAYMNRNDAQWNLLMTWRQMGVRTVFSAPDTFDFAAADLADDDARALTAYLFVITNFDAILVSQDNCAPLRQWIDDFGPHRLREIAVGSDLLRLIEPKPIPIGAVVKMPRSAVGPDRNNPSAGERLMRTAERKKA